MGNRENMDKELVNAMRLTGIVHLLTVSGMHLTLIALMMEKVPVSYTHLDVYKRQL